MTAPLLVVGDALLDHDLCGRAERLAPDAPVPVLTGARRTSRPGGAALAAYLAACDGRDVTLVTPLGDDEASATLRGLLAGRVRLIELPLAGRLPVKTRVMAGGHPLVRLDDGEGRAAGTTARALAAVAGAEAVLVADYGRGTAEVLREALAALARRRPVTWDPHPRGGPPVPGTRLVTPSAAEARHFARAATPPTAPVEAGGSPPAADGQATAPLAWPSAPADGGGSRTTANGQTTAPFAAPADAGDARAAAAPVWATADAEGSQSATDGRTTAPFAAPADAGDARTTANGQTTTPFTTPADAGDSRTTANGQTTTPFTTPADADDAPTTANGQTTAPLTAPADGGDSRTTANGQTTAPFTAPADAGGARAAADAEVLVRLWNVGSVAVTLGAEGALLSHGEGEPLLVPVPYRAHGDPCGAGDRFAAAAAARLADGDLPETAVQAAVHAATRYVADGGARGLAVGADGTPAADSSGRTGGWPPEPRTAVEVAEGVRASGGTVVAAGGCFDLLHAGHIALLQAARAAGDCLIVCVNSDASVRRRKGAGRPLVPAADRVRVLQALACVDAVAVFEEDTPERILRTLRPHIWAKGADYARSDLPETALVESWGGQTVLLPYLDGRSTTSLAARASRTSPTRG